MRTSQLTRLSALLATSALLGACSDLGPDASENVDVTMQQTDDALTQAADGWYASVAGGESSASAVDKDDVASLVVRVTEIQFLPKADEASANDDGVWISLQLAAPISFDLMALPTESESPLVIASGAVPVGDYGDVRLFVEQAIIIFTRQIDLGVAFSFETGVEYQVTIPSATETGLKTDAEFTVEADAQSNINAVNLLFSPGATFLNVTGTGTGEVILAPVIRARSQQS